MCQRDMKWREKGRLGWGTDSGRYGRGYCHTVRGSNVSRCSASSAFFVLRFEVLLSTFVVYSVRAKHFMEIVSTVLISDLEIDYSDALQWFLGAAQSSDYSSDGDCMIEWRHKTTEKIWKAETVRSHTISRGHLSFSRSFPLHIMGMQARHAVQYHPTVPGRNHTDCRGTIPT
jgi:hypothetical protein